MKKTLLQLILYFFLLLVGLNIQAKAQTHTTPDRAKAKKEFRVYQSPASKTELIIIYPEDGRMGAAVNDLQGNAIWTGFVEIEQGVGKLEFYKKPSPGTYVVRIKSREVKLLITE